MALQGHSYSKGMDGIESLSLEIDGRERVVNGDLPG